jgi:hypothetical protein
MNDDIRFGERGCCYIGRKERTRVQVVFFVFTSAPQLTSEALRPLRMISLPLSAKSLEKEELCIGLVKKCRGLSWC